MLVMSAVTRLSELACIPTGETYVLAVRASRRRDIINGERPETTRIHRNE